MQLDPESPGRFKIQWHITETCNLACRHCYQESFPPNEPDRDALFHIHDRIRSFFLNLKDKHNGQSRFHLSITGGEPLMSPHLKPLLERMQQDKSLYCFSILSNGTQIDPAWAEKLKSYAPAFVQVSMEGAKKVHDAIRGKGSYDKARQGARNLVKAGLPVSFAMTVHRKTMDGMPHVVKLARKLGVKTVWADRMIPRGRAWEPSMAPLSPFELKAFHQKMASLRKSSGRKTRVTMGRALQFQEGGGKPYRCQAGKRLLAILPGGTVLPCRRMPEPLGNVMDTPLDHLYGNHGFLKRLRDKDAIPHACSDCFYARLCRGGLRCLSYAMYGDPFRKDPDCLLNS